MNFLHEFNQPNCGLPGCTKCSTLPSWYLKSQEDLLTEYLIDPVSTPVQNIDPAQALKRIKWIIEDIMESMNTVQTVHVHDDGSETVVNGPNIHGALHHLFNGIKNILVNAGFVPWEYNDNCFLENAGIDPQSFIFEDFLDEFLSTDKPDQEE